jgi:hypothetical protein
MTKLMVNLRPFFWLLALALALAGPLARAEDPSDEYLRIYGLIQQADTLNKDGKTAPALAKYREAQKALLLFQKAEPDWNTKAVSFRLGYVSDKVAALTRPAPSAPSDTSSGPSGSESAVKPASAEVKMLEAGAEPRKVLRFHLKAGDKQVVTVIAKTAMEIQAGGGEMPGMKMPAVKLKMEAVVKDVSGAGDASYEITITEAAVSDHSEAPAEVADAMKSSVEGMKGLSFTGTISDRGVSKGQRMKAPPGMDREARLLLPTVSEAMKGVANIVQLPDEAIGAGARWEVRQQARNQGMTLQQTTTYELVSVEGDRVTAKSVLVQEAANQKIQSPLAPGAKVDLTKLAGRGRGEATFDLGQVMPSAGTAESHVEMNMGMNMGGQERTMTMKMDASTKIESN